MEDIDTIKFFGFIPDKFISDVHAIGCNEYLKAATVLKDTLLEEFPERKEEVERGCNRMLKKFSQEYNENWFKPFMDYCKRNLFVVPPHVPVYDSELEKVEENEEAHKRYADLVHTIMANEHFNTQILQRLGELEEEIEKRKALLVKVTSTEKLLEVLKKSEALAQRISDVVQLPEQEQTET